LALLLAEDEDLTLGALLFWGVGTRAAGAGAGAGVGLGLAAL